MYQKPKKGDRKKLLPVRFAPIIAYMQNLPVVTIKEKNKTKIRYFHPWVYKNEIKNIDDGYSNGDTICLKSSKGNVIGYGYINMKSEISVRLLSREESIFDKGFFVSRLKRALDLRKKFIMGTNAFRVVHSEGDNLAGLIVDKYADVMVIQFLTLGMDKRKSEIIDALNDVFSPKYIYERDDVNVRKLEGLQLNKGWLKGEGETTAEIEENGIRYLVDFANGHKTGFYLDQRDNRKLIADYVREKNVLDCFSYTGSFALSAAMAGAKSVLGIDISENTVELARKNAEINGLTHVCQFQAGNVFDELKKFEGEGKKFDVIFLDPPTFTKSKAALDDAYRGYKEINLRAMKILNEEGFLLTSSCSHHVTDEMFKEMLKDAAADARRMTRVAAKGTQSKDHPIILSIPETEYLKSYLLQIF